jgi:lycopene cyclase domain-containing protein
MTYAELNLLFLLPVAALLFFFRYLVRWRKLCWTVSALLLMTAIFDNFIVGSGIVAYNPRDFIWSLYWLRTSRGFRLYAGGCSASSTNLVVARLKTIEVQEG